MINESFSHHSDIEGIVSGVYFYRLQAGDPSLHSGRWFVETNKMIVLR